MPVGTQFTTNLARRRKLSDRLLGRYFIRGLLAGSIKG